MRASRSARRLAWLSLTPEPEHLLPDLLAGLRPPGGRSPRPDAAARVRAERRRMERLVLRGTARTWLAGLDEAVTLVGRAAREGGTAQLAPALAAGELLAEHLRLLVGLPGDAYARTTAQRAALDRSVQGLRRRLAAPGTGPRCIR
ncbi:hypothetical protein AB0M28_14285 [Streptomyces sp. NPDC051940]|uniref:hypothetical protein n=1 Tax=Streptomyces sp. NPDC051940 TaxID=3155675 RepID=UPI00343BBDCB